MSSLFKYPGQTAPVKSVRSNARVRPANLQRERKGRRGEREREGEERQKSRERGFSSCLSSRRNFRRQRESEGKRETARERGKTKREGERRRERRREEERRRKKRRRSGETPRASPCDVRREERERQNCSRVTEIISVAREGEEGEKIGRRGGERCYGSKREKEWWGEKKKWRRNLPLLLRTHARVREREEGSEREERREGEIKKGGEISQRFPHDGSNFRR